MKSFDAPWHAAPEAIKGWYAGPWNLALAISLGYAHAGIDELHRHAHHRDLSGDAQCAVIRIEQQPIPLTAGDVLVVKPGEAHTFLGSPPDYWHFVVHMPGLQGERGSIHKRFHKGLFARRTLTCD